MRKDGSLPLDITQKLVHQSRSLVSVFHLLFLHLLQEAR